MQPFVGYYYEEQDNRSFFKIPYHETQANIIPYKGGDSLIWNVKIDLRKENYRDRVVTIGVSKHAKTSRDVFEYHRPRAFFDLPVVSLERPNWDSQNSSFASDIRSPFNEFEQWEFEVQSQLGLELELIFNGIKQIPEKYQVYLLDEEIQRSINLRQHPKYKFTSLKNNSRFQLLVGTEEAIKENLSLIVPTEYSLSQNYPNPFNPTTIIRFGLPQMDEVTLTIYNMLGQKVITLLNNKSKQAGYHGIAWNGKHQNGNRVASGIYVYHLKTKHFSQSRKMIMIK